MAYRKQPLPKRLHRSHSEWKNKKPMYLENALFRELWLNVIPKNLELKTTDGSLDQNFRSTYTAVVSSNSQYICTTHGDHSVRISETERWTCKRAFVAHHRTPISARFHPNYVHIVASGCLAGEVYVFDIDNAAFEQMPVRSVGAITSLTFHPIADYLFASTAHGLFIVNWKKSICIHSVQFSSKFLLWMQFDSGGTALYAAFENVVSDKKSSRSSDKTGVTIRRRPVIRLGRTVNRHGDIPHRGGASSAEMEHIGSRYSRYDNRSVRARAAQVDDDSELVVHQLFRQAEAILHRLAATATRLRQESNNVTDSSSSSPSSVSSSENGFTTDPVPVDNISDTPRLSIASNARMLNVFLEGRPPVIPQHQLASGTNESANNDGENYSARMTHLEVQIRETRRRLEQLRDNLHRIQEGLVPPGSNSVNRQPSTESPLSRLRNRLHLPTAGPGVRALLDDLHQSSSQSGPSHPALLGESPTELFRWDLEESAELPSLSDKDFCRDKITECVVRGESAISLSADGTRIACFVPSNFSTANNNSGSSSNATTPSSRNNSDQIVQGGSGNRSPVVVVPGSPSLIRSVVAVFDITSKKQRNDKPDNEPSTSTAAKLNLTKSNENGWLPIASTAFEGSGTSLCFSPDGNFIVVGFSLRSANISSLTSPVLRIFEINSKAGTLRTLSHIRHPTSEPFWELPRLSVNCLVWIDHSRSGIVYGTNQGHVVKCCPMTRSAYCERNKSATRNTSQYADQMIARLRIPPSFVPIVPLDLQNINFLNNGGNA